MAEIEQHFEIDGFRFRLILKSASVETHSLMEDDKVALRTYISQLASNFEGQGWIKLIAKQWKEKHK